MDLVFDFPMGPHGVEQQLGIALEARDEVAALHRPLIFELTFGLDHSNGLQAWPLRQRGNVVQVGWVGGAPAFAYLDATVAFVHGPMMVTLNPTHFSRVIEEALQRLKQSRLVFLDRQHVIRFLLDDCLSRLPLTMNGIRRYNAASNLQRV